MGCCCSICCGAFTSETIIIGNNYSQPIFAMAKQMKVYKVEDSSPVCCSCCCSSKQNEQQISQWWDVASQLKKDGLGVITSPSELRQGAFTLSGQAKINLEPTLIDNGFARINPGEKLEFGSTNMSVNGNVYITITTKGKDGDDGKDTSLVLCHNYIPPHGKTVLVSSSGSITLLDKSEIHGWQPRTYPVPNAGSSMTRNMVQPE